MTANGRRAGNDPVAYRAVGKLTPEEGTVASEDVLVRKLRSTSRRKRRSVHVKAEVPPRVEDDWCW